MGWQWKQAQVTFLAKRCLNCGQFTLFDWLDLYLSKRKGLPGDANAEDDKHSARNFFQFRDLILFFPNYTNIMAEKVATKPAIKKTNTKSISKKVPVVKSTTKASKASDATTTTSTDAEKPKLTQGQKLLKSMTAQKAAKKALMKGVAVTHVSFDDDGNEANVETVIQKTAPPAKVVNPKKTNKNRPAVKKPEPMKKKKRSADEMEDDADKEKVEEEKKSDEDKSEKKDSKKPPKKAKKPKKSKLEIEEMKKDNKQEEALAYVRLFVNDRDSWKFKKVQQIWLLSNLYEIPEDEFDNVLEYLKDLQGSAREVISVVCVGFRDAIAKHDV